MRPVAAHTCPHPPGPQARPPRPGRQSCPRGRASRRGLVFKECGGYAAVSKVNQSTLPSPAHPSSSPSVSRAARSSEACTALPGSSAIFLRTASASPSSRWIGCRAGSTSCGAGSTVLVGGMSMVSRNRFWRVSICRGLWSVCVAGLRERVEVSVGRPDGSEEGGGVSRYVRRGGWCRAFTWSACLLGCWLAVRACVRVGAVWISQMGVNRTHFLIE